MLRGWVWVKESDGLGEETLDFKQHGFCASPLFLQTLGPWFPNEMQNLLSSERKTLDHWATVESVWISFAWLYSQACGHPCCLCTFSYPNSSFQSTLHLICFDTALCKQPHLSVMTFCDLPSLWRVSMFVFWIIAKSAVFPIIVVSKNKRYPECILYGWSFIETQM